MATFTDPAGERWYFGIACPRCSRFIPLGRDPSDGNPELVWPRSGTVSAGCIRCGLRGTYPALQVERRCVAVPKRPA